MKIGVAILLLLISAMHIQAMEFTISDAVITDNLITLTASLSGTSNNYYVQGVLRSTASSKYFGETQNTKGQWIDYVSSPDKDFIVNNFFVTDVKEASWSGTIKMRYQTDDPNYQGPGQYELKVRRYTGGSNSSAGDSNTLSLALTLPQPTPSPSPSLAPSPSPSPSLAPSPSPAPSLHPSPSLSPSVRASLPPPSVDSSPEGTVAGMTTIDLNAFGITPSPTAQPSLVPSSLTLNRKRALNIGVIGVGLLLIAGSGGLLYRQNKSIRYNE